ncbi:Tetratricopeptide repeat protein [Symmachiella macrocystis]|uniref:Tetratricopeptide repeat protein n=2 Tax=Symmachiella macrocystis TaxID=2527985 RepID=A0A5C6BV68_9PLAN|nr:Tetratricopeptide repeat protein [Symmachiella macrocystis]
MSDTSAVTSRPDAVPTDSARRWMINWRVDSLLILLTPLIAVPAVFLLSSSTVGVDAATISLIVTAFFATGHHLPGMIRAYGDRDLFQRFKLRFILAPPLVFLAYFPLYNYHFDLYRLIILVWATWHGFMQLYGFVRIYDAKVGSTAKATANWDWLVCLCGFATARLMRPEQVSNTLGHWYSAGGPLIPPTLLTTVRWGALAICVAVLIGFTVNYIVQWRRGPKPNPLKVVMLISGIGTWWIAMCFVDELILGIALFDICHDVQYLAIVWLYNCRSVNANPKLNRFMRYVFRRGMVLLYLGLITAYGTIGYIAPLVKDGTISSIVYSVLFTSTILHYYYDGFIWKVREKTNQANLGLAQGAVMPRSQWFSGIRSSHALKWAPAIVVLGLLFLSDLIDPPLTTAQKDKMDKSYAQTVVGKPIRLEKPEEISWLNEKFQSAQDIAATVPDDRRAQLRASILLANFGRNNEAANRLEELLKQHPDYFDAHTILAEIHLYQGNLEQASDRFQTALSLAKTGKERSAINLRLGEIDLHKKDFAAAKIRFQKAVEDDPRLSASVEALEKASSPSPSPYPTDG